MSAQANLPNFSIRNSFTSMIPNLAVTLLMNTKVLLFANILMVRKHHVKLKQTWIADIEFNVLLYHPI